MFNQPTAPTGSVVEPETAAPFAPVRPGFAPQGSGVSLASQHAPVKHKEKSHSIVGTLLLLLMTVVAVVFIYLFFTTFMENQALKQDRDAEVAQATAMVKAQVTTEMEELFAEREKEPYKEFMGPSDYGSLAFRYPRTWSLYNPLDAANGGNFEAYFNPDEIGPITATSVNALHLQIMNTQFEAVTATYDGLVQTGQLELRLQDVGGVMANLYVGTLPNNLNGAVVLIKVRDKTIIMQTDSVLFISDFYKLLETVTVIP